jgi:hypothetical protein
MTDARAVKIGCTIPVHGRGALVAKTIDRLKKQTIPVDVVLIGDDMQRDIMDMAQEREIPYLIFPNELLGYKWQVGVEYWKDKNIGAWLYLGSSDWICDNWCETLMPYIVGGADMVGVEDIYFLDIGLHNFKRMIYWPGYVGERAGEQIGTGRLLSRRILDKMHWNVFDLLLINSLDKSMQLHVAKSGGIIKTLKKEDQLTALSISTYRWPNKHQFADMLGMPSCLPIDFDRMDKIIEKSFPEARNLFGEDLESKDREYKQRIKNPKGGFDFDLWPL